MLNINKTVENQSAVVALEGRLDTVTAPELEKELQALYKRFSLEKDGYLTAYEQETAGGRKRRYYHVTDKGLKELAAQKEQWKAFAGSVEMVLGGYGA